MDEEVAAHSAATNFSENLRKSIFICGEFVHNPFRIIEVLVLGKQKIASVLVVCLCYCNAPCFCGRINQRTLSTFYANFCNDGC